MTQQRNATSAKVKEVTAKSNLKHIFRFSRIADVVVGFAAKLSDPELRAANQSRCRRRLPGFRGEVSCATALRNV